MGEMNFGHEIVPCGTPLSLSDVINLLMNNVTTIGRHSRVCVDNSAVGSSDPSIRNINL